MVDGAEIQLDREGDKQRGVGTCQGNQEYMKMIRHKKREWFGHVLRHECFFRDFVEGK